jgi:hypothetical protein
MGLLSGICNIIKRTFLYQIFIVLAFLKWNSLHPKSAFELKDRIYQITHSVDFAHPMLDKAFQDPHLAFKAFLGAQVACATIAILGLPLLGRLCGLLCAVLLAINTIVYDMTLPGDNKPIVWKDWQSMLTFEALLSGVIIVAILAQVFSCEKKCDEVNDTDTATATASATATKNVDTRREGQGSKKIKKTLD